MRIELSPSEYAMCAYLAATRDFVNKGFGVSDKQMGKDDGYQIGVDGLVAEIAVCKHFNVIPDLSFNPRGGGHDCIITRNDKPYKVDVKSTKPNNTTVFLPERKKHNAIDLYIWCYVRFRAVDIVGYFYPADIFKDENLGQSPRANEKHYIINLENIRKFRGE